MNRVVAILSLAVLPLLSCGSGEFIVEGTPLELAIDGCPQEAVMTGDVVELAAVTSAGSTLFTWIIAEGQADVVDASSTGDLAEVQIVPLTPGTILVGVSMGRSAAVQATCSFESLEN